MKTQRYLTALLFATTLFTACNKKDGDGENTTATDCTLSNVYLYGDANNALYIDTLVYTYTDANIVKMEARDYYLTFEYAGGRVTRRNYFEGRAAATSTDYETVAYNSDGTVSKIEERSEGGTELEARYNFTYNAGKLVELTYTPYWDGVAAEYVDTHFYTYAGDNITRDSIVREGATGPRISIFNYTYDGQENHFRKSGTNALFHSALILDELDGGWLPFFFSANNVTGFQEEDDDEGTKFSYTADANGNLNMMNVDGVPGIMWQYRCR